MPQSLIIHSSQGPVAVGASGDSSAGDSGGGAFQGLQADGPAVFLSSAAPFWRGWNILGIAVGLGLSAGCALYAMSYSNEVHPWVLTVMVAAATWMLFCTSILIWRCVYVRFRHSELREDGVQVGNHFWSWEQVFELKAERTWILG